MLGHAELSPSPIRRAEGRPCAYTAQMKKLSSTYEAKLSVLAESARVLQARHNELAKIIVVGVEAHEMSGLRAAKRNLADANSHFEGIVDQISDLIASERAFADAGATA